MTVDQEKCIGCGKCAADCFPNDIEFIDKKAHIKNISCFKCGHCIAVCPVNAISTDEYDMENVKEFQKETFTIEPERLLNFIQFRRSIRQFKDLPVEKETLMQIIEAGRFTQTGINMQDVSYTVVTERIRELTTLVIQQLKTMGEHVLASEKENQRLLTYAKLWISIADAYEKDPIAGDRVFFHAPAVIIVTASSAMNGALAASNMELMVNALGLGTFFSGFFVAASENSSAIKDFIHLQDGKQVVGCMVIGHPAVTYKRTVPRKSADITWE